MKEPEKKRKKNPLIPVLILLSACTLFTVLLCILLTLKTYQTQEGDFSFWKKENNQPAEDEYASDEPVPVVYTEEEVNYMVGEAWVQGGTEKEAEIKSMIRAEAESTAPSMATLLRKMFPECFVYPGDGHFYFVDINTQYPLNPYVRENYVTEDNGYRYYTQNGEKQSVMCIDVSSHQGAIDWPRVAESGVKAAMIRTGYRGYGSGKMVEDEYVSGNIQGAMANGMITGLYFFSQAVTMEEMDEEAEVLLNFARNYNTNGPIAIDVEKIDSGTARGNALSREERTALVKHFCEKIKESGYEPLIYGNGYSLFTMMNYDELSAYPIWFAYYSDNLYYPYEAVMWQYSSTGKVPGIDADVDLNVMFKNIVEKNEEQP